MAIMSIRSDLFQQLTLIRERRRAGLPVDKRTMAALKPAPALTLVLEGDAPEKTRKTLLSLDAQTCRKFEVVLVGRGGVRLEGLIQDIGLPVAYLHVGDAAGREASAGDLAARLARGRRIVGIEAGRVYPPGHFAGLIEGGAAS